MADTMRLRVLLVEDDMGVSQVLELALLSLKRVGEVVVARRMEEAVRALVKSVFDVVILDPGACKSEGDGVQQIARQVPNVPLIVLVGDAKEDPGLKLVGADEVLPKKDCSVDVLHQAMERAMVRRQSRLEFVPAQRHVEAAQVLAERIASLAHKGSSGS